MELTGISHITFIVKNLDQMSLFLCEGLGAKEIYDSGAENYSLSREKFFILAGTWIAAMEGSSPNERSYNHVAFEVAPGELEHFEKRLQHIGVEKKRLVQELKMRENHYTFMILIITFLNYMKEI